jgi:cysteine desulfurase
LDPTPPRSRIRRRTPTPASTRPDARVYLDHAATSPLRPEVRAALLDALDGPGAGNPSGLHAVARAARRLLDESRERCAAALGVGVDEVVFTSGGTESDNLAVLGAIRRRPGPVVATAVEHVAVLEPVRASGGVVVGVDCLGRVDPGELARVLPSDTVLVSVQLANNETGVLQPLGELEEVVRRRAPGALLHSDAVQGFAFLDPFAEAPGLDLVTLSAHKLGGPKGVGILVVRQGARARLAPVLGGGPQERGLRPGTEDVAAIAAAAVAVELAVAERQDARRRCRETRDRFEDAVLARVPGAQATVPRHLRVPSISHLRVAGCEAEEILLLLDRRGVCASAGAACASGALEPSHVLLAMGMDRHAARECLRFSVAPTTTAGEVERAAALLGEVADRARGAAASA